MLNEKMLIMREVLELVDLEMGYGVDGYSQMVFKELKKDDEKLNVVPSKAMRRYIESYIIRKYKESNGNKAPVTDEDFNSIILIEGEGKGRKYSKEGILLMLEDEEINKRIVERLEGKSYLFRNDIDEQEVVPNFVWEYYNEKANGMFEDVEKAQYYTEIKDDSTYKLKMKLFVIQQEIENREAFIRMFKEFDEVAGSRSPESHYYYETEE